MTLRKIINNPRFLLYLVLVILSVLSWYIYYDYPEDPLTANFFAGFIQLTITVLIIDTLINLSRQKSRTEKFSKINQSVSDGLRIQVALAIYRLGEFFEHSFDNKESVLEVAEYSNEQLHLLVERIISSAGFSRKLRGFELNHKGAIEDIKTIGELMERYAKEHKKSLEEIRPYTDPEIEDRISQAKINANVQISVITDIHDALESAKDNHPDDKEGIRLSKKLVWIPLIRGEIHRGKGLEQIIRGFFEYCLYIHKKAEDNNLYVDI